MTHLKTLCTMIMLTASVAVIAIAATPAYALPEVLPSTITSFTGKAVGGSEPGVHILTPGFLVSCKSATSLEGTVEANRHLGLFHTHFKECSAKLGETSLGPCTGLGEESGVILSLGSWHLVWDVLGTGSALHVAMLFLLNTIHFSCKPTIGGERLVIVSLGGMTLCLILNAEALTKVFEYHCNTNASGGPEDTKYYNEAGTLVNIVGLKASENEGTPEEFVLHGLYTVEFAGSATALLMI